MGGHMQLWGSEVGDDWEGGCSEYRMDEVVNAYTGHPRAMTCERL